MRVEPDLSVATSGACRASTPISPAARDDHHLSLAIEHRAVRGDERDVELRVRLGHGSLRGDGLGLPRLLHSVLDRSDHVERRLRKLVVLAVDDLAEAADRVLELHVLARRAGELLGHEVRLREEALDTACAGDDDLVLVRELVHAEDGDELILFHTAFGLPFAIFLLRNFFIGIPKDILESARIDGASEIRIFVRLILPLGLPAIASLAIFQFLWTWNDLLVALTMARNTQPLTVAIFSNLRQFGSNIDLIAPAAFFSLAIPLVVFLAFQRYFVQGLLAGSVK